MKQLIALAESQDGLVLRSQAMKLGATNRTLQRRVAEGLWVPCGDRVLRLRGYPDTRLRRARAVLLLQPTAVLTGAAALEWEREESVGWLPDGPVWVQGSKVLRRDVLPVAHPAPDVRRLRGHVLPAKRCLLGDLVRLLPEQQARDAAHRLVQSRAVRPRELLYEAEKLRRYKGGAQLMEIATDLATGSHAESEAKLHRLLAEAGITGWEANRRVVIQGETYFVDVAFGSVKVAIEVDGRAFHTGKEEFETDRYRQNRLVLAGWRVLRFTWERLVSDPPGVVREIRAALKQ